MARPSTAWPRRPSYAGSEPLRRSRSSWRPCPCSRPPRGAPRSYCRSPAPLRSLVVGCRAVSDEVGNERIRRAAPTTGQRRDCAGQRDLAARDGEVRRSGGVRHRQRRADRPRRKLDEVAPARLHRPGKRSYLPGRPRPRRVLDRPAPEVGRRAPAVEQLDEVVATRRARVAAAREDLADDHGRRGAPGGRSAQQCYDQRDECKPAEPRHRQLQSEEEIASFRPTGAVQLERGAVAVQTQSRHGLDTAAAAAAAAR